MTGALTLLELAGYVGLLLWGTHMVTSGVQRAFGAQLRGWVERNLQQRWRAFLVGVGITAVLQSSTATGLMAGSFTVSGLMGLGTALAVMLGANVGTTLITQVLSFDIGPVAPPLILAGVLTFRSSDDDRVKNVGRAAIGLGLMLMALGALVHTLAPIEKAPALAGILAAVGDQPVITVLGAAILAYACHSSVAVILLIVSLASAHVLAAVPALSLVLGANLGATLPPLIEASSPLARRLPLGSFLVRLVGCLVVLPLLPTCAQLLSHLDPAPGRLVVNFHTAFNLALAALFILPTEHMARLLIRLSPEPPQPADPGQPVYLEGAALDAATIALSNASRETLRMADMVESMLRSTPEALRQGDRRRAREIAQIGRSVDRLGGAIRGYLADLGNEQPLDDEQEGARAQEILSAVINLEHAANIIANSLMDFAVKRITRSPFFTTQELEVIAAMDGELLESLRLAVAVFLNGDPRDAARLLERKGALRRMEAEATALHVRLLREATTNARAGEADKVALVIEESGLFLKIVGDLRRLHSHIATLGYPVLNRTAANSHLPEALDRDSA